MFFGAFLFSHFYMSISEVLFPSAMAKLYGLCKGRVFCLQTQTSKWLNFPASAKTVCANARIQRKPTSFRGQNSKTVHHLSFNHPSSNHQLHCELPQNPNQNNHPCQQKNSTTMKFRYSNKLPIFAHSLRLSHQHHQRRQFFTSLLKRVQTASQVRASFNGSSGNPRG